MGSQGLWDLLHKGESTVFTSLQKCIRLTQILYRPPQPQQRPALGDVTGTTTNTLNATPGKGQFNGEPPEKKPRTGPAPAAAAMPVNGSGGNAIPNGVSN